MKQSHLYRCELGVLILGSLALLAAGILYHPWLPRSDIYWIEVTGEGAIAIAFLVVISSIYQFRESLDPEVYHPFVIGFTFLYFSALLDFIDEFIDITKLFTYTIENGGGVLGAISLVIAFGYWTNQYTERGETLTEQENQLQNRNEQLEILNRIVRHDIRNDLSVIQGMIELATDHVDSDGEEYLRKAQRSASDAIDLTENAREFIDGLSEDTDRELDAIALLDTVTAQIERVQQSYPDAEIQFDPDSDSTGDVLADDMLASLFRNLLVNAIQHNTSDVPRVTVSIEELGDTVVTTVADNGPGIPDDLKDEVFGREEKGLDSSGTGIGLYLVDQLTAQYGGEIWIEDNDPHGTIFNIQLQKSERF